jgi:hypothetical protein
VSLAAVPLAAVLLTLGFPPHLVAQDLGGWEIIYAADDELLLMIEAVDYQGDFRPMLHVHCKAGQEPRVFFRPFVEDVRMQFDDEALFVGRFTGISYGFAIDSQGKLVEEEKSADRRPMRHFANSGSLIARMAQFERLDVRFQNVNIAETQSLSYQRNYFMLDGLGLIFRELGNPCLADWDRP